MANKKEEQNDLGSGGAPRPQIGKPGELLAADKLKEELERLKGELQQAELSQVAAAKLSDEQLKLIQERLYKMIDYTVKRHDWYVDQCQRMLQIGLALIATGGAIAALFAKLESLPRITQFVAWAFATSFFGTGLVSVHLYNRYLAGDHPYRKVVDIHSWYFAYRFPQRLDPNLSKSPETAKQQVDQEASYIKQYFAKFLTHAKDRVSVIREDIEQVAILLILQRYRAQQTQKMSQWLFNGLKVSALFFVVLIGSYCYFLISPRRGATPGTSTGSSQTAAKPAPASSTPVSPTLTKPDATKPDSPAKPTHTRPAPAAQTPR